MPAGPIGQEEIQKVRLEPVGKRKLTKGEFSDYSPTTGKPVTVKPLKARARAASEPAMVKKLDRLIGGTRPGKPRKFDVTGDKMFKEQLLKRKDTRPYIEQEFDKLKYGQGEYDPKTRSMAYGLRPETKNIDNDTLRKMAKENAATRWMKELGLLKSRPSGGGGGGGGGMGPGRMGKPQPRP